MTFGIIGSGRFGALWAHILSSQGDVILWGRNPERAARAAESAGVRCASSLEEVAQCDVVFISVPISEFEGMCHQIAPLVRKDTVVADVCSVKVYPVSVMKKVFPESQPIIATHPLFGPDSAARLGVPGLKLVVCNVRASEHTYGALLEVFLSIGLRVIETTPEAHDRDMARSQALIHFIGRGIAGVGLAEQEIETPDYESFLRLQKMVVNDTWQLFFDMQTYNPYAKLQRQTLLAHPQELERKLSETQEERGMRCDITS
jgi:prephenate dehydrogenase